MSLESITKALEEMEMELAVVPVHEVQRIGPKLCAALREAVARLEEIEDTIKDAWCGCCMDTTAAVCLDQIASILGDRGSRGQG